MDVVVVRGDMVVKKEEVGCMKDSIAAQKRVQLGW